MVVVSHRRGSHWRSAVAPKGLILVAVTINASLTAATVIATGLANVKKIYDTKLPASSGGGGSVPSVGSTISSNVPRQATLSDVATSIGQSNQQPVRAYVIGQDVTDSQEAQAYLNNQKTL